MFLSCKCLNVILKYSGYRSAPSEFSLPTHEFFRDNPLIISSVDENFAVLKRQPALIDKRAIGVWNITRCINCYQYAYAISDNPEDQESEKETCEKPADNLVINKSLIFVDNSSELSPKKAQNSPPGDNSCKSDNSRLINDNSNDNTTVSTKMTLMTDKSAIADDKSAIFNDNSSNITDNSRVITDNSTTSDKVMIFSDNVPLITDNSAITADNSLTNSTISTDNSITSRTTPNINDNSEVITDNLNITDNLTLVSDNSILSEDNSTLIGNNSKNLGDNSTISGDNSVISGDNSTISGDNSGNKNDIFHKLKNHPDFSDIYNVIVIDNTDIDNSDIDDNDILLMRKKLLPGVQLSLGNLQQQYEIKVKSIKDIVDKNIKKFIAKQYEYLDNYKERGHHEYCVLSDKILRNELRKIRSDNSGVIAANDIDNDNDISLIEGEKTDAQSDISRSLTHDNFIVPGSLIFSERNEPAEGKKDMKREKKGSEKRAKRKQLKKQNSDGDDEVMFAIEGMDDNDMEVEDKDADNEDDDDDGESADSCQDEGIHIPRGQRGGHPTLAKSLPVSVPNFGFGWRAQRHNDGQQSGDPLDPHNIRASIKALAKSVHGDTVFGDLPRPRFSTEI